MEQAAFTPANVVPGIGFSPGRMLQARLFSYGDTQRYRLGVNFNHIPVNAPRCPVHSYHRDGAMRTDGNLDGTTSYWPNSKGAWIDHDPSLAEPPLELEGAAAHWDHREDEDYFEQPGNLFRKMTLKQQQLLFENTARAMGDARPGSETATYRKLHRRRSSLWRRRRQGSRPATLPLRNGAVRSPRR